MTVFSSYLVIFFFPATLSFFCQKFGVTFCRSKVRICDNPRVRILSQYPATTFLVSSRKSIGATKTALRRRHNCLPLFQRQIKVDLLPKRPVASNSVQQAVYIVCLAQLFHDKCVSQSDLRSCILHKRGLQFWLQPEARETVLESLWVKANRQVEIETL